MMPWLLAGAALVLAAGFGWAWWWSRRTRLRLERLLEAGDERLDRLQRQFERFAPPDVVERLTDAGGALAPERRQVTMLFADLRDFTALCDRLDPVVTVTLLNDYFQHMNQAVARHHGHINEHFRPEFLNRVDETVVFHPLSTVQLVTIVDIQLTYLQARLGERWITLDVTAQAKEDLAQRGYDPVYGARPLKRLIQQDLEIPIAYALVQGELRDGDTARVELKDGTIFVIPVTHAHVV